MKRKSVKIYDYQVFPDLMPEQSLVLDIGARYGEFTFPFLKRFGGRVICFEPLKKAVVGFLAKRKELGYGEHQAPLVQKAVWINREPQTFYEWAEGESCLGSLYEKLKQGDASPHTGISYDVPAVTLGDVLDEYGYVDVLKMDIEGAEYRIFAEMTQSDFDHIGQIVLEQHQHCPDRNDITGIIRSHGFQICTSGTMVYAINKRLL